LIALDVLREQDEWLSAYRTEIDEEIQEGIAEMERGEGIPEDQLDSYLARLMAMPV